MDEQTIEELAEYIKPIAYRLSKQWGADREDISQEMWVWALEHPRRVRERLGGTNKERRWLQGDLHGAGFQFCLKEKAQREGYSIDDLMWYNRGMVSALIPWLFNEEWSLLKGSGEAEQTISSPSERNNIATMLIDVQKGWEALTVKEQGLLVAKYVDGNTFAELTHELGDVDVATAHRRVMKALDKLIKKIGGKKPIDIPVEAEEEPEDDEAA
jgi:DNA-directed RNA polymerase specialized sigma24 family protein